MRKTGLPRWAEREIYADRWWTPREKRDASARDDFGSQGRARLDRRLPPAIYLDVIQRLCETRARARARPYTPAADFPIILTGR